MATIATVLSLYLDVFSHVNIGRPISNEETSSLVVNRCWFWPPHRHPVTSTCIYTDNCLERQSWATGPCTSTPHHSSDGDGERFTNGTSAQYRLYSAIQKKSHREKEYL